ncbi:hypothetical protein S83_047162 [Arachis hypogaea]
MVGSSKINRKEGNVPVEHECLLNLLPRNIWVRIATKVASNSIHDMFNMQASCKVFLDAASSETVYQHVTMRVIPLVSFLFYLDWPERRFIDRCIEAGNADAILRQGLTEYFWIGRRGIGMELLSRAWMEVSVEAESVRTSGDVESCREFFADIFWERWVDERPSDPGDAVACRSTTCTTRGTMACMNDVSRVSCVHCLADYEVRVFLEMFRF